MKRMKEMKNEFLHALYVRHNKSIKQGDPA